MGFNKTRMDRKRGLVRPNLQKGGGAGSSVAETDGQYDSGIDNNGYSNGGEFHVGDSKRKCKHRSIENHQCKDCPFKMSKFGTYFDSGRIKEYMRICQVSDSEECAEQLGQAIDLIYESFEATNIIQLRDQMQSFIGRSLQSHVKETSADQSAFRLLPTDGIYSDQVPHLKRFDKYLKVFNDHQN